jgi:hypothetical protein
MDKHVNLFYNDYENIYRAQETNFGTFGSLTIL